MKRLFLSLVLLHIISSVFGASLQKVFSPQKVKGSEYFPLYVGKVWTWEIFGLDTMKSDIWETTSAYVINDRNNNLKNVVAFEILSKNTKERWYFLEHDGYICKYQDINGSAYRLTRILPVKPSTSDKWVALNKAYKIKELSDSYVKSEFENDSVRKSGYEIFQKGVGPVEIFEHLSGVKDSSVIYKLKETTPVVVSTNTGVPPVPAVEEVREVLTKSLQKPVEMIDEDIEIVLDNKKKKKDDILVDERYLTTLSESKNYIQVGSFFKKQNASGFLEKVVKSGYNGKVFKDTDGYYKVLLEVEKDTDKLLLNIKNTITPEAFVKQRVK